MCCFKFRYSVISVTPKTQEEFDFLVKLGDHPKLDFWTEVGLNRQVQIMIPPLTTKADIFQDLKIETVISNVQDLIDEEKRGGQANFKSGNDLTWDDYYPYDQVQCKASDQIE